MNRAHRQLVLATLVVCAAAAFVHAVNCARALLGWGSMYLFWPLLIALALLVAVAVVLTGLSFIAIWRETASNPDAKRPSFRARLGLSVLTMVPVGLLAGVAAGLSALTKWLKSK